LTNEHRFNYAEERAQIPKKFNVTMAKFDAEGSEEQQQLAKANEHGFILIQSMYQCFSVVGGNEPMKMKIKKKRK